MALLWCIYLAAVAMFKLNTHQKYRMAAGGLLTGFAWTILTFFTFFYGVKSSSVSFLIYEPEQWSNTVNIFLISASTAYLLLFLFPALRLFKNWRFVQHIKKEGLHKADVNQRLFVQKIATQLGIVKKVAVHLSSLVSSPLTIGYLKPVILLPVAAMNNLTTQQTEAILLHELSHIKRYDYLVNLLLSIIQTLLYFNPFVKQFMKTVELEREDCCDALVLQFGYDKVGYASALLTLEKLSAKTQVLAIAATGKNPLINRVEKIIGMEQKKTFKKIQWAGIVAALLCILVLNSVLIIKERKQFASNDLAYNPIANPFAFFSDESDGRDELSPLRVLKQDRADITVHEPANRSEIQSSSNILSLSEVPLSFNPAVDNLIPVAADDVDMNLSSEEKQQVQSTVAATKKVVTSMQWKEVETQIADVFTQDEKAVAQNVFKNEIEKINWQNVEQNLKAKYEQVDWNRINASLKNQLYSMQLDSLQDNYNALITQLSKAEKDLAKQKTACSPLPDATVTDIAKAKEALKLKVESIKVQRSAKKIVRL
ncbi:MAG: M56 family metallopeptidase [Bacteroidota bacterium]